MIKPTFGEGSPNKATHVGCHGVVKRIHGVRFATVEACLGWGEKLGNSMG